MYPIEVPIGRSYLGRRCGHPRDLTITLTKLPVSKIPTFNHTFYLISYLISLSMAPIRRSNRARKPRDYWDPTNSSPHQRQPPAFIIYTEPPEDLGSELFHKDLDPGLSDKDLGSELSHKDLDSELSDK